jgi:hypothetical protein
MMAKVINSDVDSQIISPNYSFWKVIFTGALLGLLFCLLSMAIKKYFVSSVFCKSAADAYICANSINISGNIATIIIAIVSIITMVKLRMVQPLIVSVAAAATLWELTLWSTGLSVAEAIVWSMLTYVLAYVLFSWVARLMRIFPVIIITMVIILAAHFVTNL